MSLVRKPPLALVLSGDGINCELETAYAARHAGFDAKTVHVNDLLRSKGRELQDVALLILPGGFSFGDELGSGKILALKLKHGLGSSLSDFTARGGAVFGICNGFQVLARLGVLGSSLVLAQNKQGHFLNRWVGLKLTGDCIFTRALRSQGIEWLELPMRHGEGRLVYGDAVEAERAWNQGQVIFQYEQDVNGSWRQAAGLADPSGRVFGMMPHPEAFWSEELYPSESFGRIPLGLVLFESAYQALCPKK